MTTFEQRRRVLKTAAALSSSWISGCVTGCGGGNSQDPAEKAAALGDGTATGTGTNANAVVGSAGGTPMALPPAVSGKYRSSQAFLFQSVPSKVIPKRLADGNDFDWDIYGPTYRFADFQTGWAWTRPGGDWLDRDQVRFGPKPWFSIPVDKVQGNASVFNYTGDVTSAVQFVQTANRWNAFLLVVKTAQRVMAGMFSKQHAAPSIEVTYSNGQTATLACRLLAVNGANNNGPSTTNEEYGLPVFIEFDRPTAAIRSARLNFVITQHWSGANPTLDGYVLDPPITQDVGQAGLATLGGRLDEGIDELPTVIGAHRYLDGLPLSDFIYAGTGNYGVERNYDPAIFGTGPTDLTKFPHAGLGKWVNSDPRWTMVESSYRGEGFEPLALGVSAVRIPMPAEPGVKDGSIVGYGGTGAANAMIFLPESEFGRLGRIFVRYYFRIGTPYAATAAKRMHVYNEPGAAVWTTMAGKFGVAPDHSTSYGGVSGSAGAGNGWSMRHSWYDCDAGTAGPDEGGWAAGFHLYDFNYKNPPGYNYGSSDSPGQQNWGQSGGLGGMLYAGQWYCVETELKLNSVPATGSGFTPDGELRAWIDGRLVYERTGMVFRTSPVGSYPYSENQVRPCRELGVRGLWLNWFHGGKTLASMDRTTFYTGIVWAKDYIGPMKL